MYVSVLLAYMSMFCVYAGACRGPNTELDSLELDL